MTSTVRIALLGLCFAFAVFACATIDRPDAKAPGVPSAFESLVAPHRQNGVALEARGDFRGALNAWKVALTIDPKDPISLAGRKRVEELLDRAVSGHLREGNEALKRGVILEARRHFLAVLALDPANRAAFDALQTQAGEVRVLRYSVRRGETLATIAQLFYGDRSRSEVIWETNQLPSNPKLTPGMVLKIPEIPGLPFVRQEAVPQEARVEGTSPPGAAEAEVSEGEGVYTNPILAEAREALDREEFTVALADVDRFLSENPKNVEGVELKRIALYRQGKSLLEQEKYEESFRALDQLVKLAPNYEDSPALLARARARLAQERYNQGIRLYREEKLEAAISEWRAVLEYEPDHEAAKKNIEQAERLLKGLQRRQQKK